MLQSFAMRDSGDDQGPGFLCFCGQDWWYHNRAHSDFQLMTRIARERKVLLINSIGMRMPVPGRTTKVLTRILRKLRSVLKFLRRPVQELPQYYVMTPLMIPLYGTPWARKLSARLVRLQVRLACWWIGLREPHVFVTVPTAWDVLQGMRYRSLSFNRSDKHSAFEETDQSFIRQQEEKLLRESGQVLYVSHALMDEEQELSNGRAVFLDHGVDLLHFQRRPQEEWPLDIAEIEGPRIGFFGTFDDYVIDFDLLEHAAESLPDLQFVFVGDATCSMKRFERFPNVHWLGYRPYEEIPRYGSAFDLALMPWQDNEWIRHCNPIKMKEYLALGLETVSTPFPELEQYKDEIHVARDRASFIEKIRSCVEAREKGQARSPAELRKAVEGATWDHRSTELLRRCDALSANALSAIGEPR